MKRYLIFGLKNVFIISALIIISISQGCSSKLSISDKANPLYLVTKQGLTVIDTRTDEVIKEGFNPDYPDSIAAFYKTLLFTEYPGSDFPVNTPAATHIVDLKTSKKKKISEDQLSFLRQESGFLYGLGSGYGRIFLYDISHGKFLNIRRSGLDLPVIFIGFVNWDRQRAIVSSDVDNIEIRTLNGKKVLYEKAIRNSSALVIDNNKIAVLGGGISIVSPEMNKIRKLEVELPEDSTVFYAYGKLYIGESTSTEDKPKLSTYKVYGIADGKLIKTIKMDARDYNVLKINDLLVFLTGPHRGYALNLMTSEIEKTDITEQSVVQDGKIYSAEKDRLIIRRGKNILKTVKLDAPIKRKWDDDVSIYNRAIFSSQPTNDNFRIIDGFL